MRKDLIEKLNKMSKSDLLDISRALYSSSDTGLYSNNQKDRRFTDYSKSKVSIVNHLVNTFDLYSNLQNQTETLEDNFKVVFSTKCKNRACKIESIIESYRHINNNQEKNCLQIALMADSKLSASEWVEMYAEDFARLYAEGEHDLREIERQLYKESE